MLQHLFKSRFSYLFTGIALGFLLAITVSTLDSNITRDVIVQAEKMVGLDFTPVERDSMLGQVQDHLEDYQNLRKVDISNATPYALNFDPIPHGTSVSKENRLNRWNIPPAVQMPDDTAKLAYFSIAELASLIKQRKISSLQLTRFFLERLRKHAPRLRAVITYTESRALEQAEKMDRELNNGKYRGPLHGIPYGIKDLFALPGYPTTWGAEPYKEQHINTTATVIKKLDQAGAILIAKLSLGALAYGDLWYEGRTLNPWDLQEGSSGSSAGSAAATAAGLVPFSIGTETLGSIISPSNRCGTTGLRPTFGRVSRHGAMALSWSMDKIGPITRSARDAGMVFDAIQGPDGNDQSVKDIPFNYRDKVNMDTLTIGYYQSAFDDDYDNKSHDQQTLDKLQEMGANIVPVELTDLPVSSLRFILMAEAAAAFDYLTRSNSDTQLTWQDKAAWPNTFRAARFIPAVEYIQANRIREMLIHRMDSLFKARKIDLYVSPTFGGKNLLATNLTGHPSVIVPNGFDQHGKPTSITFIGKLYDEGTILEVARKYQKSTSYHRKHPPEFSME